MTLKDEAIQIIATAVVSGYNEAAIEFAIKVLVSVVARKENLKEEIKPEFEKEIRWLINEKVKEIKGGV